MHVCIEILILKIKTEVEIDFTRKQCKKLNFVIYFFGLKTRFDLARGKKTSYSIVNNASFK